MNQKRFRRLYRRGPAAQAWRPQAALGLRAPLALPSRPSERWLLDFVSDILTDGRRFMHLRPSTTARANV